MDYTGVYIMLIVAFCGGLCTGVLIIIKLAYKWGYTDGEADMAEKVTAELKKTALNNTPISTFTKKDKE